MRKGIIIAGGTISGDISKYLNNDDFIICADSGYKYAFSQNIKPNLIIGDFDSAEIPSDFPDIIKLNIEKNDTDTQHCVDYLKNMGIKDIIIFGATGGIRIDHTVANLQLLEYGENQGLNILIINDNVKITLLNKGSLKICGNVSDIVSVFALNIAKGVTYEGMKYPLKNGTIKSYNPYGVSNELMEPEGLITVKKGKLLIIYTGGGNIEKQ